MISEVCCSVMALANRTLIRIDQDHAPDVLEEIDLNKVMITSVFEDLGISAKSPIILES